MVKDAVKEKINVVSLPGPNAAVTALVCSSLSTDGFVFLGFLRRKPGKLRKEVLKALELEKTVIFYESPHRIKKTIAILKEILPLETQTVIAREITKKFEEILRGSLEEIDAILQTRDLKGEMVVMLGQN